MAADLYALGVLLYQALTDLHPFNPELPDKELVAAIATIPPVAPHLLNPLAPRSLSDIAMKLLEKKPEDRYPETGVLLQMLEKAAERERDSPAWKVPLFGPAQQRTPPEVEEAPPPNMFEELKLNSGKFQVTILDIHQPGGTQELGIYQDGPIIGRVVQDATTDPALPGGTLLYEQLWTGPGIQNEAGKESVIGRYTQALLPDGRMLPVCLVVGSSKGRWAKLPGSKPGAAVLPRTVFLAVVRRWP